MAKIGNRVYTKIQRTENKLIEKMRGIPAANLDDNMGRIYAIDSAIRPLNACKLCGPAFTVKVPSGDNLMFHKALDLAQPGDVIVVSGIGNSERSFCGELMLAYAVAKKLGGFVIDGFVRDFDGYGKVDFPVYARGIQPNGPYKNGPGEINVPVACGGQAILPGDILVGDADGLVVVPRQEAEEVAEAALKTMSFEEEVLEKYQTGKTKPGTKKWVEEKLEATACEIIDSEWGCQTDETKA